MITGPPPSVTASTLLARAVASFGLVGSMHEVPTTPLNNRDFTRLHWEVRSQRMTGLLWSAIAGGWFPVTQAQLARAQESHLQSLAATLLLERLLVDTVSAFDEAGIAVRALKGTAVGHLDYPDPGMRTFGDIGLLVPSEAFDDAVAEMAAAGHVRRYPQPRPGFDRRYSKGTSFRTQDGLEIDLHRTFTTGPLGARIALHRLWERRETFTLGGVAIQTLPAEERLLHAAYHAALGDRPARLVPLRDIAQIMLTHDIDVRRFRTLMRESGGEAVVAQAVSWAWQELHLADILALSAWARDHKDDRRSAADLAVYGPASSYAAQSWATVRAIPGFADKARFVFALAIPQRSYLSGRHESQRVRLQQGISQIRRARSER